MTQTELPMSQSSPDELQQTQQHEPTDLASLQRTLTIAGGAALAVIGLARRSLGGAALAAAGGGLIYRGLTVDPTRAAAAEPEDYFNRGIHVEQSFTIDKTPWELYEYWRSFENLPRFMSHLQSVTKIDEKRSHWVACGPAGYTVEWDAEIINDEPNALIAWRSLDGADVDNAGSVRFVPGPEKRGTQVKVVVDYIPPAGRVGAWFAKLFGEEPEQQIREDLRKFKRLMETGEVPTIEGQPRGTCSG